MWSINSNLVIERQKRHFNSCTEKMLPLYGSELVSSFDDLKDKKLLTRSDVVLYWDISSFTQSLRDTDERQMCKTE